MNPDYSLTENAAEKTNSNRPFDRVKFQLQARPTRNPNPEPPSGGLRKSVTLKGQKENEARQFPLDALDSEVSKTEESFSLRHQISKQSSANISNVRESHQSRISGEDPAENGNLSQANFMNHESRQETFLRGRPEIVNQNTEPHGSSISPHYSTFSDHYPLLEDRYSEGFRASKQSNVLASNENISPSGSRDFSSGTVVQKTASSEPPTSNIELDPSHKENHEYNGNMSTQTPPSLIDQSTSLQSQAHTPSARTERDSTAAHNAEYKGSSTELGNPPREQKSNLPVSRLDPTQVPNPQKDLSSSGPYPYPVGDMSTHEHPTEEIEYQRFSPQSVLEPSLRRIPEYSSFVEHSKIPWVVCINMISSVENTFSVNLEEYIPLVRNCETSVAEVTSSIENNCMNDRNMGPPRCERCRSYFCAYSGVEDNGCWKCNFCGMKRNKLPIHIESAYRHLRYSQTGEKSEFLRSFFCSPTVEYIVNDIDIYGRRGDELVEAASSFSKFGVREPQSISPQSDASSKMQSMHVLFCIEIPPMADPVARHNFECLTKALSTTITKLSRERSETFVSFVTYARSVHFYDFDAVKTQAVIGETPRQICMGDVHNPFVPIPFTTRGWLSLRKDITLVEKFLSVLMEYSPINDGSFQGDNINRKVALGAAVRCAQLILNQSGGHVAVFSTNGCTHGVGQIKPRDENHLMGRCDDKGVLNAGADASSWWKDTATDAAKLGISFDLFFLNDKTNFLELNTISQLAHFTSGRVLNVHRLIPSIGTEISQETVNPLEKQLETLFCRPIGHSGVLRVRVSKGTRIKRYYGHFLPSPSQEIEVPLLSPSVSYLVEIEHEGSSIEMQVDSTPDCTALCDDQTSSIEENRQNSRGFWYFQAALLYTCNNGFRRIRIASLRLPITNQYATLFRGVNLECTFAGFSHHALSELAESGVFRAKDAILDRLAQLLFCYRRQCSSSQHTGQLILPESLKLLPLYIYALLKTKAFKTGGSNTRMDARSIDLYLLLSLSPSERISYVYPYMVNLQAYTNDQTLQNETHFYMPPPAQLCYACFRNDNAHAMHDMASQTQIIYIPKEETARRGFVKSGDHGINLRGLTREQQMVLRAMRLRAPTITCVPVCTLQGSGDLNESVLKERLVEDKAGDVGPSYIDFLCQLHGAIRELLLIS